MKLTVRGFMLLFFLVGILGMGIYTYMGAQDQMHVVHEYEGFKSHVKKVWFGSDGKEVCAICLGYWKWNRASEELVYSIQKSPGCWLVGSREKIAFASGGYATLDCFDLTTQAKIRTLEGLDGGVTAMLLLPDGRQFLAATGYNLIEGEPGVQPGTYDIKLVDFNTLQQIKTYHGHVAAATSLCLIPNKQQFLSAGDDLTLRLWNIDSGELLHYAGVPAFPKTTEYKGREIISPFNDRRTRPRISSVSPNGKLAVWNSTIWDIENWQELKQLVKSTSSEWVLCSEFSPDGSRFASGHRDGTVRLWDTSNWTEIYRVFGHENKAPTLSVAFSPDGKYLLTGGEGCIPGFQALQSGRKASDLVVRLWKLPEVKER